MYELVHVIILLFMPPLLLGIITKTKAFFAGRKGPSLFQLYFDLFKLFRKGVVISRTTTLMFLLGPVVSLAAVFVAGLILPMGKHEPPIHFTGDAILVLYLFALARFFTTAAALDTGSPFEGMGAARDVTFACTAEPVFFLSLIVLARLTGSWSLSTVFLQSHAAAWSVAPAEILLITVSLFIVMLAEACRIPFDDPNTHLELTMIHEVMVLDHSGPPFGVILYSAALKLFVIGGIVVNTAIPFAAGKHGKELVVFLSGMVILAVLIGIIESGMARLRLISVPKLLVTACILAAFSVVLLLRKS